MSVLSGRGAENVAAQCTNLKALKVLVYGPNGGLVKEQKADYRFLRDALQDINSHLEGS